MFDLEKIQKVICQENVHGWLFYNFHNLDPCADSILHMPKKMLTRRWFYWVPAQGQPIRLVHKIEAGALDHLPGQKLEYARWSQLHERLSSMLNDVEKICMQYSPNNAIPYVSFVDAGTIELVKSAGVEIVSSANLVQYFEALCSDSQLDSHVEAAKNLRKALLNAFAYVKEELQAERSLNEYQVQKFLLSQFEQMDMTCDHPPIVAVNGHSGDPHYEPCPENSSLIKRGDFLLIDLWAKFKKADSIYADITWVAMVDDVIPDKYIKIFDIVKKARDTAVELIESKWQNNEEVFGFEVDDACRKVIDDAGYGEYFIHRTGHSIGKNVHWKGVNMDNFETRDERKLLDRTCFSIEPGIYLEEFGVRLELDVCIRDNQPQIFTQPIQKEIVALF